MRNYLYQSIYPREAIEDLLSVPKAPWPITSVIFLVLALTAGKMEIARVAPDLPESLGFIELRFVFLALAGIASALGDRTSPRLVSTRLAILFAAFLAIAIVHMLVFFQGEYTITYLTDFTTLLVVTGILVATLRSELQKRVVAASILSTALALCLFGYFGIFDGDQSTIGWSPLGTTLSFLRVVFVGMFCATYLLTAYRSGQVWLVAALLVLGYGLIASSMKVAFIIVAAWAFGTVLILFLKGSTSSRLYGTAAVAAVLTGALLSVAIEDRSVFIRIQQALGVDMGVTKQRQLSVAEAQEVNKKGLDPNAPVTEAVPGRVLPWICIAIPDISKLTVYDYLRQGVDDDDWECLFVDKTARLAFLLQGLRQFAANPLLGGGFGSYFLWTYEYEEFQYRYPHNVPLEILAAGGVVMFSFFALLVGVYFLAAAIDTVRSNSAPLLPFMLGMFVAGLVGGDFYDIRFFFISALAFLPAKWESAGAVDLSPTGGET